MIETLIKAIGDLRSQLQRNVDKHLFVVVAGLIAAIATATALIGKDNFRAFFAQFNTEFTASGPLAVALFLANCILAILILVAGLLELNFSREHFEHYVPAPPAGAWIINVIVCVLLVLQAYKAITNLLQYCILYTLFLVVDAYFRYAIANTARLAIKTALTDSIALSRTDDSIEHILASEKARLLLELYVYYRRYPMWAVLLAKLLLTFTAITLVILSHSTKNATLNNVAYVTLIYSIVLNELFSWAYRIRLFVSVSDND